MDHGKRSTELKSDEKCRNASFQTRKSCLMKKASELSILCDTDVCLIIYGPATGNRPETFPPNPDEVKRIISRYRAQEMDRHPQTNIGVKRKQLFQEEAMERVLKKSKKSTSPEWERRINDLSRDQAAALLHKLRSRLEDVKSMIASKEKETEKASCDDHIQLSTQESDVHYNAKPLAFWFPGCPSAGDLGATNPVMTVDAMGCIQPGGPSSSNIDRYVPVLCYVPLSSNSGEPAWQVNRAHAGDNFAGNYTMN